MEHSSGNYLSDLINPNYQYIQPETLSEIDRMNGLHDKSNNEYSESDPIERVALQKRLEAIAKISDEESENILYHEKENVKNNILATSSPIGKLFSMNKFLNFSTI